MFLKLNVDLTRPPRHRCPRRKVLQQRGWGLVDDESLVIVGRKLVLRPAFQLSALGMFLVALS